MSPIVLRIETSAVRNPGPTDSDCEISIAVCSPDSPPPPASPEYVYNQVVHHSPGSDTVVSFPHRSHSPWSDMGRSQYSGEDRDDFDMSGTDSPASSYGELEHDTSLTSAYCPPSPPTLRSTRQRRAPSRLFEGPSTSNPRAKTSHSTARAGAEEKVTRAARVRSLKLKANTVSPKGAKGNKAPAPEHQRDVLRMIFDEITPYPDEAWISKLAIHFNCGYDKIKNWFSNTRQKDAMQWRTANPSITEQYNLASTLRNANIEGREMKLRPQALDHCAEGGWSDGFFYEVVLVNDWKMVGRSWEQRMREDAAYGLLELGLRGLP